MKTLAYALHEANGELVPYEFERRPAGLNDIVLEILFCGVCHSDLLSASNATGKGRYPMVPGHEIIGRVTQVGENTSRFSIGDIAGVGCIVDSCRHCSPCEEGDEQYCAEGFSASFNGMERDKKTPTQGGYSKHYVLNENYAVNIPANADLASLAPLLCGGVTTYAPLKRANIGAGMKVGVLGLGGLGHLAIKLAKAMGASPVMLTSSASKVEDAKHLGADGVVLTSDPEQMKAAAGSLDFILNTISAPHDPNAFLGLLKRNGTMCLVGLPEKPLSLYSGAIIFGDKSLSGSFIGGIQTTQEMVDFCVANNVAADVELIDIDYINTAWQRMEKNDVKYRFVIDMASLV